MAPITKPYSFWARKAKAAKLGWSLPIPQFTHTIAVVRTATNSTAWMEIFSVFQARGDLLDRCRKGSPAVFARPPHPQTHEQ